MQIVETRADIASSVAGKILRARVYSDQLTPDEASKVAVIAHPYGPLGGSQDDPVVVDLAKTLALLGILTVTFDFASPTSWRGKKERDDYLAVLAETLKKTPSVSCVYCCGYSYGTLCLPSAAAIHSIRSELAVRYILVSPLLPPVSTLLTLSVQDCYAHMRVSAAQGQSMHLAVFGTTDQFTSSTRLERVWQGSSMIVPEADHFWRNQGHLSMLLQAVCRFVGS